MKFERVDDRTVKCFLSNEELEEYDIDYRDFVTQSDKARELIQEVVQQASEQVGYRPPKFAFEMQIMVVPDQGMLLTLKESDGIPLSPMQQLMICLEGLKAKLAQMRGLPEGMQGETDGGQQPGKAVPEPERPSQAIFAFEGLNELMSYAAGLPSNLRVESRVYKMNDLYFLYLARGSASYVRYSKACVQALEFSQLCGADESQLRSLEEHGNCLIAEKALKKLRA